MKKPILHLNVKKQWFDMIKSGEKKEEYRDNKFYWQRQFFKVNDKYLIRTRHAIYGPRGVIICFSNGYAKNRPQVFVQCKGLRVGIGKKEWGASGDKQFILSLGEIIK
jgi:hypothetical protein